MARRRKRSEVNGSKATQFQPGHEPLEKKQKVVFSVFEVRKQVAAIEHMMTLGRTQGQIVRWMKNEAEENGVPSCGWHRTINIIERVKAKWEAEDEQLRPIKKAAAIRRLMVHIDNAKGKLDEDGRYPEANFAAIAKFESQLADLEGTRAPVKVDVNVQVQQSVAMVLSAMTPDQMQKALNEQLEMERDAQAFRVAALPARTG
jgi:hypothetical protein